MVTTSLKPKFHDAQAEEQEPYWVEVQLVDEQGAAVANMPWQAENSATPGGYEKALKGISDDKGLIRIEPRYGSELRLFIDAQPLANEMEQRPMGVSRDPNESTVREGAQDKGYIWHYAVMGELCRTYPDIEKRNGEPFPPQFHFPQNKSLKGFKIRTNELEKRHVIEIFPFRAWELVLHHQSEYSIANAINLGASASLAYADDDQISYFFINQCQDLSRIPQIHKDGVSYNTLVRDVPFRDRYNLPVFMDTSQDTSSPEDADAKNITGYVQDDEVSKADGDTHLFYVYNTDKIIISWRGTASLYNIGTDLAFSPINIETCDARKKQCTTLFPVGKVHDGFWSGYNRVGRRFKKKINILNDLADPLELFICGHSLGGALALIHSVVLKHHDPLLYTYGMPRTFTRDAIAQLLSITHFRHVNDNDPVPAVPPEANLDNELYKLWGPLGKTLGMLWSTGQALASQAIPWGDCYWHHGKPVVFLTATQSREWKECKRSLPTPGGCITLKRSLPIKAKFYLVPALAEQDMQNAGQKQKEFKKSLTAESLTKIFPEGSNPERGFDITFGDHFITTYMPYMNNKLLELIDRQGIIEKRNFTEHLYNIDLFKKQMRDDKNEIPEKEHERNEIFFNIEDLLSISLSATLTLPQGNNALVRFTFYGKEALENA